MKIDGYILKQTELIGNLFESNHTDHFIKLRPQTGYSNIQKLKLIVVKMKTIIK